MKAWRISGMVFTKKMHQENRSNRKKSLMKQFPNKELNDNGLNKYFLQNNKLTKR